jgi:hypothetical protein
VVRRAVSKERIPAGVPVSLGLDLGWKYDTTALVPLWVRDPGSGCSGRRRC